MTFLGRDSFDYAGTARVEASRRARAAASKPGVSRAEAARDAADWKGIVARAAYLHPDRPARLFGDEVVEGTEYLAGIVLRTARRAVENWRREGMPGGEPEARAILLLRLAQKFAELIGHPVPTLDRDGQLVVGDQPERTAA